MPLCFAHPAAVIPINSINKRWFSLSGLVMGSITPDFEYFARMKGVSMFSHTWSGLFWFDMPLALLLMVFYNDLIKNNMIDHLPQNINRHLSAYKNADWPYFKYNWPKIALSVFIGAATHIFWDSFTHKGGFFVERISFLNSSVSLAGHQVFVYSILQQLSTVLGIGFLAWVITKLPKGEITSDKNIGLFWGLVAGFMVITVVIRLFTGLRITDVGDVLVTFVTGFLIGLIITSCVVRKPRSLEGFV
jgi:hypothetical protein